MEFLPKNIISKSKEWCNKNKYFILFCSLLSNLRYPDNFSNYQDISKIRMIKFPGYKIIPSLMSRQHCLYTYIWKFTLLLQDSDYDRWPSSYECLVLEASMIILSLVQTENFRRTHFWLARVEHAQLKQNGDNIDHLCKGNCRVSSLHKVWQIW